jgi:glycerophosphoryl diester phosphodiesterase
VGWRDHAFFALREAGPLAVAHRGGGTAETENTLEAFLAATDLGYRHVEIDLRGTRGGELVAWHGRGRERLRPGTPLAHTGAVAFEDVLEALPAETRFFLDLKDDPSVELLARAARRTGTGTVERLCVGSFSGARTRRAVAAIAASTGVEPPAAMTPAQARRLLARSARPWSSCSPSAQLPAWMASHRVVAAAHAGGALVIPWTVNDEVAMRALLDRGVDGLMTDEPALLRRVLEERGEWAAPRP